MRLSYAAVLLALVVNGTAHAESRHAVRPLGGAVCMQLAISPKDAMDPKVGVPILETPSASARIVSYAATNVIVEAPQQPTAGFLRVVRPTGEKGWMEAKYLRPWHDPYTPAAACYPAMMSDGKPGFGFTK
jgi:hypothetical protein